MDRPQSVKKISCCSTIVPFSIIEQNSLIIKKTLQKPSQRPSWLINFNSHWPQNCKKLSLRKPKKTTMLKLSTKSTWEFSKSFFQAKKEIELEMLNLFNFLGNIDIPDKLNLINKFNLKLVSGEITTIEQMLAFLKKTEELANCIKVYLLKNEYSENFMREISFDVFEKGFQPKTQEDIRNSYPSYFASNS